MQLTAATKRHAPHDFELRRLVDALEGFFLGGVDEAESVDDHAYSSTACWRKPVA
jgi:hypothetical protein